MFLSLEMSSFFLFFDENIIIVIETNPLVIGLK